MARGAGWLIVAARKEQLAASVARGLREAIVEARLAPGERLKEDAVAAMFGVSRSPVREAFHELASEGFVVLERAVGARVAHVDADTLEQLYFAREALEPILVAETARRISDEELAEARAVNARAEDHAAAGELADYLRLDAEMHLLLLRAARLDLLCDIAVGPWQRTAPHRLAYTSPERIDLALVEHRMILDAIARRAPEDAADLYRDHIRHTRVALARHAATPDTEA